MATRSTIERKVQSRDVLGWVAIVAAVVTFGKYLLLGAQYAYNFMLRPEGMAIGLLIVGLVSAGTFLAVLLRR